MSEEERRSEGKGKLWRLMEVSAKRSSPVVVNRYQRNGFLVDYVEEKGKVKNNGKFSPC
jgi:hypothetical protein